MCGIFAALNATGRFTESELVAAVEKVSHRGPDNIGYFSEGDCFLGHTRLSILGLEKSGNQPFHFENLSMVFNGEVFNYIEIREVLAAKGYDFSTHSDTEVVIKAYHKWGGEAFSRFNGMWAIVIYDRLTNNVIVSRDRFGQKPLFVMREGGALFFASEVQQLAALSSREIDLDLVQDFLKEGNYEGGGRTFFKSIEEFPKAHYCVINAKGDIRSHRYWDYWGGRIQNADDASFAEFETLLKDAVRLRLRADVPFGVLLSGGVDSTIVAAYSSEFNDSRFVIPAFTYASGDSEDEVIYAKRVADKLGISLAIKSQDEEPAHYIERLKLLVRHMGRGHSSPAIVSVDYLYESVAESGIKVALDGQGADELLAGYKTYFPLVIPLLLAKGRFKQALLSLKDAYRFGPASAVILFLRNVMPPRARALMRRIYGYEGLFRAHGSQKMASIIPRFSKTLNRNALNRYLIQQHDNGLENLLFYGDIVSMRHSVENRSPFLDHRLVDFAFSRSERLKVWNGEDKYVLRKLPVYEKFREELDRRKIGFSSNLKPSTKSVMIQELRNSGILRWPIFSKRMSHLVHGSAIATAKYERLLFRLYQVHLWNEIFQGAGAQPSFQPQFKMESAR